MNIVKGEQVTVEVMSEFSYEDVLRFAYSDKDVAVKKMRKSASINFKHRHNDAKGIAKIRARSAIKIIRKLSANNCY